MDQINPNVHGRVPPKAVIITSGSELMLGQMADTNSAWLSAWLSERGVNVVRHVSVGDDLGALVSVLTDSLRDYEVTLVTGGLGPTEDDLTRLAVARTLGKPLEYRPALATQIVSFMIGHGHSCSSNNFRQAWLPAGCFLVENPWGTAPAFSVEEKNRVMLFTPGVPQEMKNIVNVFLGPKLAEKFPARLGHHRTTIIRASALGESLVDDLLGDLIRSSKNPVLGLLAGAYETRILITSKAMDAREADRLEAPIVSEIVKRLGPNYVGQGDLTLAKAVCLELKKRSLRLGLVDTFTLGSAGKMFLDHLEPENLAALVNAGENSIDSAVGYLFGTLGADLVGIIQNHDPGQTAQVFEKAQKAEVEPPPLSMETRVKATVIQKTPSGYREIASDVPKVGRTKAMAMARAGALMALLLWNHLKNLDQE
ncbi:MAG: hypothetical protein LBF38_02895 [Deltaproteobacteria bacterium]|jgi:competence/damage-inducible protein CinA-like protein|nr:hypothetical protein [Deltaproteobacteria bacterium]